MPQINPSLPTIGGARGDGETALRADITAILSLLNGTLDSANMAASFAAGPVEPAFSSYKVLHRVNGSLVAGNVNGVYGLGDNLQAVGLTLTPMTSAVYLDPSFFAAGTRTTRYQLRLMVVVNNTAPTGNFTAGLYQVTSVGGAGVPVASGLGAVTSGSAATVTAPIANSLNVAGSGDFPAPTAGGYVIGLVTTATIAAGSGVAFRAELLMRQT